MERLANFIFYGIIIFILYFAFPFFAPFMLALIVAMILEPVILFFLKKTKVSRLIVSPVVITSFFVLVGWVGFSAIKRVVIEFIALTKKVPNWYDSVINNKFFGDFYRDLSPENQTYIKDTIATLVTKTTDFITKYAGNFLGFIMEFPAYFVAIIVFSVASYIISIELPRLKSSFLNFFAEGDSQSKMELVIDKLKLAIIGFLQAQIVFSTLTFIICVIGLKVLGFELVIFLSLLIVVVDLLPIVGTGTVLVPWSVYLFITGDFYQGIGLIVLFVLITVFRKIIEPKLLGNSIGLNPLPTLISMYVGLELVGIIGMFLAPALLIIINALEEAKFINVKLKI